MNTRETDRLQELKEYGILDTLPEKEYNYIVELAAAICDTPVSLINLVQSDKTWFKASIGVPDGMDGTPRNISFCSHAINTPNEIMQVNDTLLDSRFVNNPLVTNDPNLRFYAGAPLVTPKGYVLGTLCVFDNKPRELNDVQLTALNTLAKKVMENLEVKKQWVKQQTEYDHLQNLLQKVSDRAPGALFKFKITPDGVMSFPFVSNGISKICPGITAAMLMQDHNLIFDHIHDDDKAAMAASIHLASKEVTRWEAEYRIITPDNRIIWHRGVAEPEIMEDGTILWYGTFQDITKIEAYIQAIELQNQRLFEIAWEQSHIVRAPLSRIMGLTNAINTFEMDDVNRELLGHLVDSVEELDNIIRGIVKKSEILKVA